MSRIWWVDDNGIFQSLLPSTSFESGPWVHKDDIAYRHLLPGECALATACLPDRESFDYDKGEMEAKVLLFAKKGVLPNCPLAIRLYVNADLAHEEVVDPAVWKPDFVEHVFLGRETITRDQLMIIELGRAEAEGEDTVGVLGCSFQVTGVEND